ncbi:uncharacterized protein LOC113279445 [Papaver somniferum]|uniref:uncharacterized protein LOC113279445 n=1 Tax=Papaver somniferum TaxID=3469 RepID=UPI000E6FABD0|nr:uncharacterized protein LOC113279445 [Papaver somniferum]
MLGQYMDNIDLHCIFCNHPCESLQHLFFDCSYAKSVWMLPPLEGLNFNLTSDSPFLSLYTNWITGNSTNNVIEIIATKCWLIWKERCLRVFQDKSASSLQLSMAVIRHIKFWSPSLLNNLSMNGESSQASDVARTLVVDCIMNPNINKRWLPPNLNQFKLNFDASWIDEKSIAGYGLIFRSATGTTVQAGSGAIFASSPEEAEALALLEAAKWATIMDFKHFWIEGDCKGVLDYAKVLSSTIHWRNQAIVNEAQRILKSCEHFLGFTFSQRSSNNVADVLAKHARKEGYYKQQWRQMPSFLSYA